MLMNGSTRTARDIASALAGRAETVATFLLPQGKRHGSEWCVGSIRGEPGQSLKIRLSGDKAGVWSDFATGQGGDLLDLWAEARGTDLSEAMRDAGAWLGLPSGPTFRGPQAKAYRRPKPLDETAAAAESKALRYLTETRKLSPETLARFRVVCRDGTITLPSYRCGDLVAVKYLEADRDAKGKKRIRVEADCEPCLFGW